MKIIKILMTLVVSLTLNCAIESKGAAPTNQASPSTINVAMSPTYVLVGVSTNAFAKNTNLLAQALVLLGYVQRAELLGTNTAMVTRLGATNTALLSYMGTLSNNLYTLIGSGGGGGGLTNGYAFNANQFQMVSVTNVNIKNGALVTNISHYASFQLHASDDSDLNIFGQNGTTFYISNSLNSKLWYSYGGTSQFVTNDVVATYFPSENQLKVAIFAAGGQLTESTVSNTELAYLSGMKSNVQTTISYILSTKATQSALDASNTAIYAAIVGTNTSTMSIIVATNNAIIANLIATNNAIQANLLATNNAIQANLVATNNALVTLLINTNAAMVTRLTATNDALKTRYDTFTANTTTRYDAFTANTTTRYDSFTANLTSALNAATAALTNLFTNSIVSGAGPGALVLGATNSAGTTNSFVISAPGVLNSNYTLILPSNSMNGATVSIPVITNIAGGTGYVFFPLLSGATFNGTTLTFSGGGADTGIQTNSGVGSNNTFYAPTLKTATVGITNATPSTLAQIDANTNVNSSGITITTSSNVAGVGGLLAQSITNIGSGTNWMDSLFIGTNTTDRLFFGGVGSSNAVIRMEGNDVPRFDFLSGNSNLSAAITYSLSRSNKTANYAVLSTESGRLFSNKGATGVITNDLPVNPTVGLLYTFVVQTNNAYWIHGSNSTIRSVASVTTNSGFINTAVKGSWVTLIAVDTNEWYAISISTTNGAAASVAPTWGFQ